MSEENLQKLQDAKVALATGERVQKVQSDSESVEYASASLSEIERVETSVRRQLHGGRPSVVNYFYDKGL